MFRYFEGVVAVLVVVAVIALLAGPCSDRMDERRGCRDAIHRAECDR